MYGVLVSLMGGGGGGAFYTKRRGEWRRVLFYTGMEGACIAAAKGVVFSIMSIRLSMVFWKFESISMYATVRSNFQRAMDESFSVNIFNNGQLANPLLTFQSASR